MNPDRHILSIRIRIIENHRRQGLATRLLICYFYPSFAWTKDTEASPYTIGFITEHGEYPNMAFLNSDGKPYNSIPRNKQININVTLSGATHVNIDFEVVEWTNEEITVPEFE